MTGHVYIARPRGADFFKVGRSASIDRRLRQLRTAYGPADFHCVAASDPGAAERALLAGLAPHRRPHDGSSRPSETVRCGRRDRVYREAIRMLRDLEEFPVARVRDARVAAGALEFKVQWAPPHHAPENDSWEPLDSVRHLRALDAFMLSRRWALFSRDRPICAGLAPERDGS